MTYKAVKLSDNTKELLNRVKGMILLNDPGIEKLTDDIAIQTALKNYIRGFKPCTKEKSK